MLDTNDLSLVDSIVYSIVNAMVYSKVYSVVVKLGSRPSPVGSTNFSKSSQIEPLFLYSMCMGEIRSHAKFQV